VETVWLEDFRHKKPEDSLLLTPEEGKGGKPRSSKKKDVRKKKNPSVGRELVKGRKFSGLPSKSSLKRKDPGYVL